MEPCDYGFCQRISGICTKSGGSQYPAAALLSCVSVGGGACGKCILAAYLYFLLQIKLLCYLLRVKTLGLLLCFFVHCAGHRIVFYLFADAFSSWPMGNSILGIHYSQYYSEMDYPLEYSMIYFAVGIGILMVAILGLRKRLGGYEHD